MTTFHWRIVEFAEIDSTNAWVKSRALEGAPTGLVARADFQSAGRGRLDRTWEAEPGGSLLASVLLDLPTGVAPPALTVAMALAARDAIGRLSARRPQLKWPNDVVFDDTKVAGILAETVSSGGGATRYVVGIGVNLTYPGPPGLAATSVREATGITVDPRAMLDTLLTDLEHHLGRLGDPQIADLRSRYSRALSTLGRRVRVEGPAGELVGEAVEVDDRLRLVLRDDDGNTHALDVGDVVHVRPQVGA